MLVRVLAVAQVLGQGAGEGELGREALQRRAAPEPGRDLRVVRRAVRKGLGGQAPPQVDRDRVGAERGEDLAVSLRPDHHYHVRVVLCRCPQHGRTADVDLLHNLLEPGVGPCGGLREGVEVDTEQVDGAEAVFAQ